MSKYHLESLLKKPAPWILGILNITPDSFSDGGQFVRPEQALLQAERMVVQGAHILDVGAEASGPGSSPISAELEIERLAPLVVPLCKRYIVSIDTYKAKTARFCLERGAHIINDISGLRADAEMAKTIAEYQCFVVIMYSKETSTHPNASDSKKDYKDIIAEISEFFEKRVQYAISQGIQAQKIILDPGMGRFLSHSAHYSWELLRRFEEFSSLGARYPLLVGTSRKGFLGGELEHRDAVSQYTALHACEKGASIVRTHNPPMMRSFFEAATLIRPSLEN